MPGYLFDTNHISAWEEGNPALLARLRRKPVENIVWVCPISLGEIECGLRITQSGDPMRRSACRKFINDEALDFVFDIRLETRESYADVMSRIWHKHTPASSKIATQAHLSQWGVDVNDVWIAAVALEHNLILLTTDRMDTIRDCVPELQIEDWLV